MQTITLNNTAFAVIEPAEEDISDVQTAPKMLMRAKYEASCRAPSCPNRPSTRIFFILSTDLAGEILQKVINYGFRIDIYGVFSHYASKPLLDFIPKSNNAPDVFFQPNPVGRNRCAVQALNTPQGGLAMFPGTERLLLRKLQEADFDDFRAFFMDHEMSRMMGRPLSVMPNRSSHVQLAFAT